MRNSVQFGFDEIAFMQLKTIFVKRARVYEFLKSLALFEGFTFRIFLEMTGTLR